MMRCLQHIGYGTLLSLFIFAAHPEVLAAGKLKHGMCTDYMSRTNYMGQPYRVFDPEDGRTIRRHEGMDFCSKSGTVVIAIADGRIWDITWDNPLRGGSVTIKTNIMLKRQGLQTPIDVVYVRQLHIDPDRSLQLGQSIRAGTSIGKLQKPGKEQIGPRAHVHISAGTCSPPVKCHINPNDFWAGGSGKITCFDPKNPPPQDKLVAPLPCWR